MHSMFLYGLSDALTNCHLEKEVRSTSRQLRDRIMLRVLYRDEVVLRPSAQIQPPHRLDLASILQYGRQVPDGCMVMRRLQLPQLQLVLAHLQGPALRAYRHHCVRRCARSHRKSAALSVELKTFQVVPL